MRINFAHFISYYDSYFENQLLILSSRLNHQYPILVKWQYWSQNYLFMEKSGEKYGMEADDLRAVLPFAIIIKLMLQTKFQTKALQEIVYNIPNFITGFRFLLNYVAAWLFPTSPQTAGLVLMISVILDYFDGIAARRYNQCTFFGEVFDWITDIFNYAIVLFWWNQMEPHLLMLVSTLFCLEIVAMMSDIISKCYGFYPKLTTDHVLTSILKYTMNVEQKGYTPVGIGYWNTIFHFICIIARVLSLTCQSELWNYIFIVCVPFSISYVWMHIGYTINVLDKWNQEFQEREIRLKFINH